MKEQQTVGKRVNNPHCRQCLFLRNFFPFSLFFCSSSLFFLCGKKCMHLFAPKI